jgi:PKD repeat protein
MKEVTMKSILIILITLSSLSAQDYRYVAQIFTQVNKISNVVYGTAPFLNSPYSDERNTTTGNLVMDIYQPLNDDLNKRPVIIFVHSGGFSTGNRNHDDMVAFCNEYAKRGYVTVTIDYRKGVYFYADANLHYTRAVYRGIQDGRTAVRYLRANAALYGIDPSKIYMGGSSAGAFIGLHNIYMDKPEEKPYYAGTCTYGMPAITAPDLGGYEIGNNLDQSGEADGIFSLWGAVGHTALITSDNNEPVFLVHGTADTSVPFDIGHPFGVATFPQTHGSNRINMKLDSLSLTNKMTYFVEGVGHEFYGTSNGMWANGTSGNAYWDSIMVRSVDFFHGIHKPDADFSYAGNGLTVDFTDLSTGSLSWHWNFGDSSTGNTQNPSHTYAEAGTYTVTLYIENDIRSFDTATYDVTVSAGTLSAPEATIVYSAVPELSWPAVTDATSYKIYSSADPYAAFPAGWTLEATVSELTWTDTNAGVSAKKFYVVIAVN